MRAPKLYRPSYLAVGRSAGPRGLPRWEGARPAQGPVVWARCVWWDPAASDGPPAGCGHTKAGCGPIVINKTS